VADLPGFKVTTLSYVMSLMPDTILKDLEMERHGYVVHPVGPYVVPLPGGRVMIEYDDPKQNYEEFAAINKHDADALEQWEAWMGGIADVLGPVLMTTRRRSGRRSRATCWTRSSWPGSSAGSTSGRSAT